MLRDDYWIWIDLEMTGLDVHRHRIVEMATIITDTELNLVAEGPNLVIHQPEEVLAGMDDWVLKTHTASGLVERIRSSTLSEAQAQAQTLDFLRAYSPAGVSPMCGNSVHQDRRFLSEQMPDLEAYFHYRNIDVSTLKELARRWAPEVLAGVQKKNGHRALADIQESIAELKYYQAHFLIR